MSTENLQNSFRYERKYKLNASDYNVLANRLFSEKMKIHHPPRYINNIYFDTLGLDAYFENVEGESERNKYRVRWYGNRFNLIQPTFEVKMKKDQVNRKVSVKLPEVEFRRFSDAETIYNHTLAFLNEHEKSLYFDMFNKVPTLLNGYQRDYFVSLDGTTRLTIDKDLFFYNCKNGQFYDHKEMIIVEVKYASDVEPNVNFEAFDLILGKSSKYVSGLNFTKLKQ